MSVTAVRVPAVVRKTQVHEIRVSLDEFDLDEVAEHLRCHGYSVDGTFSRQMLDALDASKLYQRRTRSRSSSYDDDDDPEFEDGAFVLASELSRASTLLTCGQRDAAREYILAIVSESMERPL